MTITPEATAILQAGMAGEKIGQAAHAAYWLRSYGHEGADHQIKLIRDEFAKLIATMAKLGITPTIPSAKDFANHAQSAFDDACPEDASGYEIGQAWQKVGQSLHELAVEQIEEAAEVATSGYLHLGKAGAAIAAARDAA